MSSAHTGTPSASPSTTRPTVFMTSTSTPGVRERSARSPYCARRSVFEQDALLPQTLADGVRFAEVLAVAGIVPGGDRGFDLGGGEARASLAPGARGVEKCGGRFGKEPEDRPGAREVVPRSRRGRSICGITRAVQLAEAVEDEAELLRGVQVVVHRGGKLLEEGRERAGERPRRRDRRGRSADQVVRASERLVEALERARRLLQPPRAEVQG